MFDKAKHPRRVFVATVQQILEFREACWHTGLPWGEQILTITVPFSEAKGPTNARHQAATLYRNEDYFLQIDSHTTFIQARMRMLVQCQGVVTLCAKSWPWLLRRARSKVRTNSGVRAPEVDASRRRTGTSTR